MTFSFERWGETILGAIVAAVAIGFFAFAAAQAGQTGARDGYDLTARFQRVDGINVGSDVRISGVKVGVVRALALDPDTYLARLTLAMNEGLSRVDAGGAPVMLLGDFNMTDQFDEYGRITQTYVDVYREAGEIGFGFTYPSGRRYPLPPLLRLDYIFRDDHFRGLSARAWPESGSSDHRPVVAALAFLSAGAGAAPEVTPEGTVAPAAATEAAG